MLECGMEHVTCETCRADQNGQEETSHSSIAAAPIMGEKTLLAAGNGSRADLAECLSVEPCSALQVREVELFLAVIG